MTPWFAFFTFLNAFWIMLFIALPFSATHGEKAEGDISYAGAPKNIRWKKAFTIATILALLVTLALALTIKSGIVAVRNG